MNHRGNKVNKGKRGVARNRNRSHNGEFSPTKRAARKAAEKKMSTGQQKLIKGGNPLPNWRVEFPDSPYLASKTMKHDLDYKECRKIVAEYLSKQLEQSRSKYNSGVRRMYYLSDYPNLTEHLSNMTKKIIGDIDFTFAYDKLTTENIHNRYGTVLVAPPLNTLSNGHTKQKVHRDYTPESGSCEADDDMTVLVFMLLLSDVHNADGHGGNGTVRFYKNSSNIRLDPNNPKRSVKNLEVVDLNGREGEVYVFDAKTLHHGLPNRTTVERVILHWYVTRIDRSLDYEDE